jgi:antitoxin (DNA-binding transcriptional repressor) of toxin-antitoxin stability system
MKVIPLAEAKNNLDRYGELCKHEPVIVTVNGEPAFEISPLDDEDDDFMNRLIQNNPEFRAMLEARRNQPCISAEELLRSLDED